ncbi:MerR family transcriptional regulator [Streptomyces sp. SCR1-8]|uniref:MerR family transcriptional regulator n=1 Tax=Streptomyces TaxID=1883 RepID=UPI003FCCD792
MEEHLTVGHVAKLAGVSVRTLHHYDGIGLVQPSARTEAGYRAYEPPDRDVTAVEPSAVMRAQRPAGAAPCVAASAESLPFEDRSFDAAMAVSTVPHWPDPVAGLREMRTAFATTSPRAGGPSAIATWSPSTRQNSASASS